MCFHLVKHGAGVLKRRLLQRSLSNTEDECTHLKEMSERGQEELRELANKYNAAVNEIKELTDKIKVPEAASPDRLFLCLI